MSTTPQQSTFSLLVSFSASSWYATTAYLPGAPNPHSWRMKHTKRRKLLQVVTSLLLSRISWQTNTILFVCNDYLLSLSSLKFDFKVHMITFASSTISEIPQRPAMISLSSSFSPSRVGGAVSGLFRNLTIYKVGSGSFFLMVRVRP